MGRLPSPPLASAALLSVVDDSGPEVTEESETCPNGTPGCPGVDADELPCFDCCSAEGSR